MLLCAVVFCMSGYAAVNAETLAELEYPKAPFYRVGISELPEKQYIQAVQKKVKVEKTYAKIDDSLESNVMDMTYADLSIKRLSKEIAQELEFEEQDMIADLSLLWQGAAMQSDTINFALYKLANPDADKPDSKSVKKVLTTIASMSTLVGASMANPLLAGSSLIGGNILNIMSQDTKALNYKYTRVTDADMIILIRKIEDLQQNAVNLYYDYMSAKKQLEMTTKLVEERQRKFELAQQNNAQRELIVITDAYYRMSIDRQRTAKSEFFAKRAALEQFVGNETFVQFEAELAARENGEKTKNTPKAETESQSAPEPAYSQTIENVENYTKNLKETENQASGSENGESIGENLESKDKTLQEKVLNDVSSNNGQSGIKTKFHEKFSKKEKKTKNIEDSAQDFKTDYEQEENALSKEKSKGINFFKKKQNDALLPLESELSEEEKFESKKEHLKLEPLDEIKAPDLKKDGYSIYSEGN